jgi:hypothetical protein
MEGIVGTGSKYLDKEIRIIKLIAHSGQQLID